MASSSENRALPWRPSAAASGNESQDQQIQQPPLCPYFLQNRCSRGTNCRYSHAQPSTHDNTSSTTTNPSHGPQVKKKQQQLIEQKDHEGYQRWKRHLRSPPDEKAHYRIRQLWESALLLLGGDDHESKQKLAQDLVSMEFCGRRHVQYLMELPQEDFNVTICRALKDFLLVVTHSDLLHSLAVEVYVGEMFTLIRGSNGDRIMQFLAKLQRALTSDNHWSQHDMIVVTNSMSTLLRWTLRKEFRVRFHEDLTTFLDQLQALANKLVAETDRDQAALHRQILEMRAIASTTHEVVDDIDLDTRVKSKPVSMYPRVMEPPGGRHDNDHADIGNIAIFPTISEVKSDQADYLPFIDRNMPHHLADDAARHIDTQFRLFRHDTFAELKDALARLHVTRKHDPRKNTLNHLNLGDIRANQYKDACIYNIAFQARSGLEFNISLPQRDLAALRYMPEAAKPNWWAESKRLSEGILVSLITINKSEIDYILMVIVKMELPKMVNEDEDSKDENDKHKRRNIVVTVKLANVCEGDIRKAVMLSCAKTKCILIEFPGIIPATFRPILEDLQLMQKDNRLPFREWILPGQFTNDLERELLIPPPLYARRAGFTFSLESILLDGKENVTIQSGDGIDKRKIQAIQEFTSLDQGQSEALVAALTREFAFIQGPPGTGKSYLGVQLMKVLLHHKQTAQLGPIIVVCYTNHALDQFLEHLLTDGIKKIIRIGRQSKSEMLEHHNLSGLRRGEHKTRSEYQSAGMAYSSLQQSESRIQRNFRILHTAFGKKAQWNDLGAFILADYPDIARQFRHVDGDGFKMVGEHPFDYWARSGLNRTEETDVSIDTLLQRAAIDARNLSQRDRRVLTTFWLQEAQDQALSAIFENIKQATAKSKNLQNIHDETSRRVLGECDIIGVTTTGLAKSISLLQHTQAKVVIFEEAGEVMEPHLICALLPTIEHFIQIGDHQQLRPQINSYALSLESQEGLLHQLDRSQFERLSVGEPDRLRMPLVQLNLQRRMRPEISSLIRQTIYPKLQDHQTTWDRDDVVGFRSNLFWLDHNHPESNSDSEIHHKSHSNDYEVDLTHAMVRHVIRQGVYKSSDIAVLTPYAGQLSKLQAALRNDFEIVLSERDQDVLEKVSVKDTADSNQNEKARPVKPETLAKKKLIDMLRIATIDNFQGEEAKIIIVSLVRSNDVQKLGFLRTTNRINVLLSRAQNGMYLIGNAETYSNIKMWQQIIENLRTNGNIGRSIGLCCPRHKDTLIEVTEPEDFTRLSPEGGCQLACGRRLNCGHTCHSRCHADSIHKAVNCSEPCQRLHHPCGHACQKATCGEPCGICEVII